MNTLIVIPARYGSTRFPGKPLHKIAGRTMLERVASIARTAAQQTGAHYTVATDHEEIATACRSLSLPYVMTDKTLRSGSDRVLAAAQLHSVLPDVVVNLQGDSPFSSVDHVVKLIRAFEDRACDVVTPVIQLRWDELDMLRQRKLSTPFSGTTCVRHADGRALWFSKAVLPSIRDEDIRRAGGGLSPVYRHIGLYAYRLDALVKFQSLPVGFYEDLEGLEQLRFLENDMVIQTLVVEPPKISMSGVDTPQDAELAAALIERYGDPFVD
jgi:3-deoxy-manno-octulosonate cytidylyltransferase (CMP-KDO synthetase)